jgi:hypothetical protein
MKCLSIVLGHEHILGDKIAKFEVRALAALGPQLQRRIYSSIINMFVSDRYATITDFQS